MKRKVVFSLAALSLFAVSACGESTSSPSSPSGSQSSEVSSSESASSALSSSQSENTDVSSDSSSPADSSSSADSSDTSSSAPVVSSDSSDDSSSESSSVAPVSDDLTDEVLSKYQEGFTVRSTVKTDSVDTSGWFGDDTEYQLGQTSVVDDAVSFYRYSSSYASWDEVAQAQADPYEKTLFEDEGGKTYTATLNMNNTLTLTPLYMEDEYTTEAVEAYWSDFGLSNFFKDLSVDDFTKEEEGVYALDLSKVDDAVKAKIPLQLFPYGDTYLDTWEFDLGEQKLNAFSITVKEGEIVSCYASFDTVEDYYSDDTTTISAEFLDYGPQVTKKLSPLEENKYPEFDQMMATLAEGNYDVDYRSVSTDMWYGENATESLRADGTSLIWTSYDEEGNVDESVTYYQPDANHYQAVVTVGDRLYPNMDPVEGTVKDTLLATFDISSSFFDKETVDGKDVYTFSRDDFEYLNYSSIGDIYKYEPGSGSASGLNEVTVTIDEENGTVAFKNVQNAETTFEITYSNIGKNKDLVTGVQPNCDALTWDEVIDTDDDTKKDIDAILGSEVLNRLPTPGGFHPVCSASANDIYSTVTFRFECGSDEEAAACLETTKAKFDALLSFTANPENDIETGSVSYQNAAITKQVPEDYGSDATITGYLTIELRESYGTFVYDISFSPLFSSEAE